MTMIAYFDCFSGISGDMTLGALMDLGVPVQWLQQTLSTVPVEGFRLSAKVEDRMGIHGHRAVVETMDTDKARDHQDIRCLITASPLADRVKERCLLIFDRLAQVESRIHHADPSHVHFHELGGTDALVDIIGSVLGLDYLDVTRLVASPIPLGSGFTSCSHGTLPVPVPATLALLAGCPVYGTGIPHELVTPTGAAIVTALCDSFGPLVPMKVAGIGYGVGSRRLESRPNLLRIVLGEPSEQMDEDRIAVVESNVDDMNPEHLGYLMERLFEDGALDVVWIPVFMKKNRPGTLMQVLCAPGLRDKIVHRILTESTTTGVRTYEVGRCKLSRDAVEIETPFGKVRAKRITDPQGTPRIVPEYEVCREIAMRRRLPLREVYETIVRAVPS